MSVPTRSTLPMLLVAALGSTVWLVSRHAHGAPSGDELEVLATRALGDDVASSLSAVDRLRESGQHGVDALLGHSDSPVFARVLDAVCAQKDCATSHLYWYTDLEKAKAEAHATQKPILSLRLLGRLDDDWSCANSRFFRTVLYAQPALADYLRTHFVLHWESVRPVPKVTVDFGDGRKLETTITGNSIHYVLNEDGVIIDAIPGLYGAAQFRAQLERAETVAREIEGWRYELPASALARYHAQRLTELSDEWARDMRVLGQQRPLPTLPHTTFAMEPADLAMRFAVGKAAVESTIVRRITAPDPAQHALDVTQVLDDPIWTKLAQAHVAEFALDPATEAVVRRKYASRVPNATPDQTAAMLRRLQLSLAADTLRNELLLRRTLHTWLQQPNQDLHAFNERVYSELFLMPSSDPWLGLMDDGVFDGLPGTPMPR